MTDSQMFLLVVTLVYLSECAIWTNLQCVAVYSRMGFWWRWTRPGKWFGNRSGGLLFEWPLPPLGTCFVCQMWPISISPRGIYSNVSLALELAWRPECPEQYVAFDDVERIQADDKKLLVNGKMFCRMSSSLGARQLVALLRTLHGLPENERAEAIEQALADGLNIDTIDNRLLEFYRRRWLVRVFSNGLFFVVFVAAPVAVTLVDWVLSWVYLLIALVVSVLMTVIAFRRAHATLFPDDKSLRRTHIAVMILNPLSTIRAHDLLARHLLATFHPLAVTFLLGQKDISEDLARRLLLDLRHPIEPICQDGRAEAVEVESWYRGRSVTALESFVEQNGVSVSRLLAAEPPLDDSCRSYCPRCRCQYVMDQGQCESCGGIPLLNWAAAEGQPK